MVLRVRTAAPGGARRCGDGEERRPSGRRGVLGSWGSAGERTPRRKAKLAAGPGQAARWRPRQPQSRNRERASRCSSCAPPFRIGADRAPAADASPQGIAHSRRAAKPTEHVNAGFFPRCGVAATPAPRFRRREARRARRRKRSRTSPGSSWRQPARRGGSKARGLIDRFTILIGGLPNSSKLCVDDASSRGSARARGMTPRARPRRPSSAAARGLANGTRRMRRRAGEGRQSQAQHESPDSAGAHEPGGRRHRRLRRAGGSTACRATPARSSPTATRPRSSSRAPPARP